jgi:hypothetical protein
LRLRLAMVEFFHVQSNKKIMPMNLQAYLIGHHPIRTLLRQRCQCHLRYC